MPFRWNRRRARRTSGRSPRAVLIRQILLGCCIIGLFALLVVGIWHGTRVESLTIETVHVAGGETISHDAIRSIANEQLAGSQFLLIPNRFAWFYPESQIMADISSYDRVASVSVERTSGTELSIQVQEYRPDGLWCASAASSVAQATTAVESGTSNCVFVDETGYAFDASPSLDGATFLRYSDPARTPTVGTYAYDAHTAARLDELEAALAERYEFDVVAVVQLAGEELVYLLANGATLKVSQTMPLDTILANLDTILGSAEFRHLQTEPFVSIDLRYGDKVFVKEEETVAASTDTDESNVATSTDEE